MGLFNKSKKNREKLSEKNNIIRADAIAASPVPVKQKSTVSVSQLLEIVKEKCDGAQWQGDKHLVYKDVDLSLTVKIGECGGAGNRFSAQLLFVLEHPYFDDELVESSVGVGSSIDEAMKIAAESFCASVLTFIIAALKCTGEETITTTIDGNEHVFHIPCTRAIHHYGLKSDKPADLWNIVKNRIPQYLGTKKAYWIKLYSSYTGQNSACEVRINGIVYPDITDLLYKAAAVKDNSATFSSDKQFILLIQDDSTYKSCPFDIEQVRELTWEAIEKMKTIHDKDTHKSVFEDIRESTPITSLGRELCAFIPEIYSQVIVNYRDSDGIMPVIDRNVKSTVYMKSQIRSYGYIQYAIYRYLEKYRPSSEENIKILTLSAKFGAVNKAVGDGAKLEDLRMSALGYPVDEDYVIW